MNSSQNTSGEINLAQMTDSLTLNDRSSDDQEHTKDENRSIVIPIEEEVEAGPGTIPDVILIEDPDL